VLPPAWTEPALQARRDGGAGLALVGGRESPLYCSRLHCKGRESPPVMEVQGWRRAPPVLYNLGYAASAAREYNTRTSPCTRALVSAVRARVCGLK
jgi:hypothetical protein